MIRRAQLRLALTVAVGWVFLYAGRTSLYPLLPFVQAEHGLSATQVGLLLSAFWVGYFAAQFPAGALSDHLGPKWVLVTSYALAGLALLATGLVNGSFGALLGALACYGAGSGAYFPAEYPIFVRHVAKETRGLARGLINAGMSLGLGVGMVVVGPVYRLTGSWQAALICLAAPVVLLSLAFAFVVPYTPPTRPNLDQLRVVLRSGTVWKLYASSFCSLYGFWVLSTWTPTLLQTERAMGIESAGWVTAIVAAAALPGGFLLGAVSDRLGRKGVSLLAFPIAGLAIWMVGHGQGLVAIVGALAAYGLFGKMAWQSVEHSWMSDIVARNSPALVGSLAGVWSIPVLFSSILSSLVTGWLKDLTGSLSPAYLLAALLVVPGWLILFLIEAPLPRREGAPSGVA